MIRISSLAAAAALALQGAAASTATVTLSLDAAAIRVGDTFTVSLATSADTPSFAGFQTALTFDPSVLEELSANVNPIFTIPDTSPGGIAGTDFGFFLDPTSAPDGAVALGSVTFRALAVGTSAITFAAPGVDGIVGDTSGAAVVLGPVSTTVSVAAIPVPATATLLLLGLGALGALRRRRGVFGS